MEYPPAVRRGASFVEAVMPSMYKIPKNLMRINRGKDMNGNADKRTFTLNDILTEQEVILVTKIYRNDNSHFRKRVHDEIVLPNMDRINKALGQENDPGFITHAIEYVMMQLFD
jgi:hypothetical protein